MSEEIFWAKWAAIGQIAGAIATFLAVIVSLYIARSGRRPRLKLKVGERMVIGGDEHGLKLLMFSVANMGERPVHIRGIGWSTGWLRWGPAWIKSKAAIQLTGSIGFGTSPPYELQPGAEISSYALMENFTASIAEKADDPLFSRDYPFFGRRATRVKAYAYTADGHTIRVKPEPALVTDLLKVEGAAKNQPRPGQEKVAGT